MADIIKRKVQEHLISKTDFLSVKDKLNEDQLRVFVLNAINEVCKKEEMILTEDERVLLIRELVSAVISFGPLRPLMEDNSISEIMVNGPRKIYIQRKGHIGLADARFDDDRHLLHTIQKILAISGSGRRVDESSPYVDFSLSDGSRVNIILPPVSLSGPVITIRKFSSEISKIEDLLDRQMLNKQMAEFLVASIKAKLNIVFCGATGTGKTTTLNVLSRYISEDERVITIEDTAELQLLQEHVVKLQSKPTNIEGKGAISIRDLFINSLRMRPDRIIIGEVRGSEALDLIQAITSGHTGSLAIVHADSPQDCFNRMVTMILISGIQLSVDEIRKQIASAVDLFVHTELFLDGKRRITHITDTRYLAGENKVVLEDVFHFRQQSIESDNRIIGDWVMNKKKPSFYEKFVKRNVKLPDGFFE
ncbi:MAG: ATPase, T2SS/T4P/T4SS family [Candidatus Omnitrophota bacterium]